MKYFIACLILLLIATNGLWFLSYIDQSVTLHYNQQQIHQLEQANKQIMDTVPNLVQSLTKDEIVSIVKRYADTEPFAKEGCLWIGWYGFKFDDEQKLIGITPSWDYQEPSICHSLDN